MSVENQEIIRQWIEKAIIDILIRNNSNVLAIAQVIFGELFEVNGFTIVKSKHGGEPMINPPRYGHNNSFWIRDEVVWRKLKERIKEAYEIKTEEEKTSSALDDIEF